MTDIDDLNSQIEQFGYIAEEFKSPRLGPISVKPRGRREPIFRFDTVDDALEAFRELADTSQRWSLDLEHGNVDVDRTSKNGPVTPRDGGESFNLSDLAIAEWTGATNETVPPNVPALDVRRLTHIVVLSEKRPSYGGWWYLRPAYY